MDQYGMRQYSNDKIKAARKQADEYHMVQAAKAEREASRDSDTKQAGHQGGLLAWILNWLTSGGNAPLSRPFQKGFHLIDGGGRG